MSINSDELSNAVGHTKMILRSILACGLLLVLSGCDRPQEIQKDALIEKTKHWKEPKVAIWFYAGSKDGRDYFLYRDLGIEEKFSVASGEIDLTRTFPPTEDQKAWIVMPWGPTSRR